MTESHHIRLVAAFEIRPPSPTARWILERGHAERLGGRIAEDLAQVVPGVTRGHLVVAPALLEPAQLLHPDTAPWSVLGRLGGIDGGFEPGVTSLGAHAGQPPAEALAPLRSVPEGLLVCLPLLLAAAPDERESLTGELERVLFERGGLRPPALGELAEATALEPVHGQLMTQADLFALVKVQLAGAGLDSFWPPVEHAWLEPGRPTRLELPGGVDARWRSDASRWELAFVGCDERRGDAEDWALWLRGLRQTAALLDTCLVRWRAVAASDATVLDPDGRWAERRLGAASSNEPSWRVEHDAVGLIAYRAPIDGVRCAFYPLDSDAIAELERHLRERGATEIGVTRDLGVLDAAD